MIARASTLDPGAVAKSAAEALRMLNPSPSPRHPREPLVGRTWATSTACPVNWAPGRAVPS